MSTSSFRVANDIDGSFFRFLPKFDRFTPRNERFHTTWQYLYQTEHAAAAVLQTRFTVLMNTYPKLQLFFLATVVVGYFTSIRFLICQY
jgi:hypothetical protein